MKIIICTLVYGYGIYTNPDGNGIWQNVIKDAAKKQNIQIENRYAPRVRCLKDAQVGTVHAVIDATTKASLKNFVYPRTLNGDIDKSAAIGFSKSYVYKNSNSKLGWDGERFTNLKGSVLVQRGNSAVEKLKAVGVKNPDVVENSQMIIEMISIGKSEAGVVDETQAELSLKNLKTKNVVVLDKEFSNENAYLIFNSKFYNKHKKDIENLWNEFRKDDK